MKIQKLKDLYNQKEINFKKVKYVGNVKDLCKD